MSARREREGEAVRPRRTQDMVKHLKVSAGAAEVKVRKVWRRPAGLVAELAPLGELARNLYWTWNAECGAALAQADPTEWAKSAHQIIRILNNVGAARQAELTRDVRFMARLRRCTYALRHYLESRTWFQENYGAAGAGTVAYFSMEYGLHESLPIYAGGLGVLAGDHVKSASDLGVPLVGVGILWKQGYVRQRLDGAGRQVDEFRTLAPEDTPLREIADGAGRPLRMALPVGAEVVSVRGWRLEVGRVPLVLLDTDVPENKPKARQMTRRLYSGDRDTRIRQEILLGVGGWRFLRVMGLPIAACHLNEGHAAFAVLERVAEVRETEGCTFAEARRRVAATSVFTTHTPVPAGNETFAVRLFEKYMGGYAERMGVDRAALADLGRVKPGDKKEPFGMTPLALRMCDHRNGVSKLHGAVARRMWSEVWEERQEEKSKNQKVEKAKSQEGEKSRRRKVEKSKWGTRTHRQGFQPRDGEGPIGAITNGIHLRTWLHPKMAAVLDEHLPPGWEERQDEPETWQRVETIPDAVLWAVHQELKAELIEFVREKVRARLRRNRASAGELAKVGRVLSAEALTIGFARRFAGYKRAALVFEEAGRLAKILNNVRRPVQILFAGKAHPADGEGKALVHKVAKLAAAARFRRRVVFVEDYEMDIARHLVAGVDVWLNNPRKPQEASGTSGMKPALHGGLNLSILDGWWPEGFDGQNGWAIGKGQDHDGSRAQDKRDAAELYRILERQVVPLYYARDRAGVPVKWIARMKHAMATIPAVFNSHRQVKEYWTKYYLPALGKTALSEASAAGG